MAPFAPLLIALFRLSIADNMDEQSMLQMPTMDKNVETDVSDTGQCLYDKTRCRGYDPAKCKEDEWQGCKWFAADGSNEPWCACDPDFVAPEGSPPYYAAAGSQASQGAGSQASQGAGSQTAQDAADDPALAKASDEFYLVKSGSGADLPLRLMGTSGGASSRLIMGTTFEKIDPERFRLPVASADCEQDGCIGPGFALCKDLECTAPPDDPEWCNYGCHGHWDDAFDLDRPLVSGSTVSLVNEANDRGPQAYQCSWGPDQGNYQEPCGRVHYPLHWGQWGAVTHVIKIIQSDDGAFVKAEDGAAIRHDDYVIFERMWRGSPEKPDFADMWEGKWLLLDDCKSFGGRCSGSSQAFTGAVEELWKIKKASLS